MTNRIAIWLLLLIAGFFVLDHYVLQLDAAVYLGRRALDLIEWLAFWR
ncbi:hypothetical protein AADZ90_009985 [Aestuariibius sp. 2305UL40-4]